MKIETPDHLCRMRRRTKKFPKTNSNVENLHINRRCLGSAAANTSGDARGVTSLNSEGRRKPKSRAKTKGGAIGCILAKRITAIGAFVEKTGCKGDKKLRTWIFVMQGFSERLRLRWNRRGLRLDSRRHWRVYVFLHGATVFGQGHGIFVYWFVRFLTFGYPNCEV